MGTGNPFEFNINCTVQRISQKQEFMGPEFNVENQVVPYAHTKQFWL
jgi:hypothetical protein